jgi:hypothetical protein
VVAGEAAFGEAAVAGEDRPPLGDGALDQLGVVERRIVGDVDVERAEPAGESAEHGVGEQPGRLSEERSAQNRKARQNRAP